MAEQGDGAHARPNEQPPVLPEGGDWGDMDNFFGNNIQPVVLLGPDIFEFLERAWDPEQFNNLVDDENDDSNIDNENDDSDDNYNFVSDDNQNSDNSNDEEESNDGHQDENALAGADVDLEVNQAVGEVQEDPLLGGSGRRFREEDSEDEKSHPSKYFHWWDEFATSASEEEDSLLANRGSDEGIEDKRGEFK